MRPKLQTLGDRVKRADLSIATTPSVGKFSDAHRGSRHARGYGSAWDKLRLVILERDNYVCQCATCNAQGLIKTATEVDHITNKAAWSIMHGSLDGVDDPSNLQAINEGCHRAKTAREGARGGGSA